MRMPETKENGSARSFAVEEARAVKDPEGRKHQKNYITCTLIF